MKIEDLVEAPPGGWLNTKASLGKVDDLVSRIEYHKVLQILLTNSVNDMAAHTVVRNQLYQAVEFKTKKQMLGLAARTIKRQIKKLLLLNKQHHQKLKQQNLKEYLI